MVKTGPANPAGSRTAENMETAYCKSQSKNGKTTGRLKKPSHPLNNSSLPVTVSDRTECMTENGLTYDGSDKKSYC